MEAFQDLFFHPEPIVWLQQLFGPGHPVPFRVFSELGVTWGVILAVGVAFWLWGRETAYAVVGIAALQAVLSFGLNRVIDVSRPTDPAIVKYESIPVGSFPSGHVLVAVGLWGLLYALRKIPLWVVAIVVVLISLGRLYLGVHYLTDVVGGIVAGALVVWIYAELWTRLLRDWLASRSFAFFFAVGLAMVIAAVAALIWYAGENPFFWNSMGLLIGGVVGLLLEARYVRYAPAAGTVGDKVLKVAIGLAGLIPLALIGRTTGAEVLALGATMAGLGALWAAFLAPALFVGFGLSEDRASEHGAAVLPAARARNL